MKGAEKKHRVWFWTKTVQENIKTLTGWVIVQDYWQANVLAKSLEKPALKIVLPNLANSISLTGIAIANSFEKTASDCLRKSCCVPWTRRVTQSSQVSHIERETHTNKIIQPYALTLKLLYLMH